MVLFHSTNDPGHKVRFKDALMEGLAPNYGLYTISREQIPKFSRHKIQQMKGMSYADIAHEVLRPFLIGEMNEQALERLINEAYDDKIIPTDVERLTQNAHIMWLTQGPTYSFKDYAARFFGRMLNHFLQLRGQERLVLVATSGDTGGAIAHALHDLPNVKTVIFYPGDEVSDEQRRQMTTFENNVYAISVKGGFDVCQDLAKNIIRDKEYAKSTFADEDRITSANSISIGRLLPQIVFPFFAFSRLNCDAFYPSIPSGNFGNMMGTVIGMEMGLPIPRIIIGVNENDTFSRYLSTGRYEVGKEKKSPSSAMNVAHPSNLARLIDFYGGHMYDKREQGVVVTQGVIDVEPDLAQMKRDIIAYSISDERTLAIMKYVHDTYKIDGKPVFLDPHGAVAFAAYEKYGPTNLSTPTVIYETAWAGKFKNLLISTVRDMPEIPPGIIAQQNLREYLNSLNSDHSGTKDMPKLSGNQIHEAKELIRRLTA